MISTRSSLILIINHNSYVLLIFNVALDTRSIEVAIAKTYFPNCDKMGRYCYGKPNQSNFVWLVWGIDVCKGRRSVGRGQVNMKRWHFD